MLGKIAEIRRMPSPQPSLTGEGSDAADFAVADGLKTSFAAEVGWVGKPKVFRQLSGLC